MIYTVEMSKGGNIKIDEEDLAKIRANLSASLIQVKQGIINPSFMVMIVPTNEKDVISKAIIDTTDGTARVIGTETLKVIADKMNILSDLK